MYCNWSVGQYHHEYLTDCSWTSLPWDNSLELQMRQKAILFQCYHLKINRSLLNIDSIRIPSGNTTYWPKTKLPAKWRCFWLTFNRSTIPSWAPGVRKFYKHNCLPNDKKTSEPKCNPFPIRNEIRCSAILLSINGEENSCKQTKQQQYFPDPKSIVNFCPKLFRMTEICCYNCHEYEE